MSRSARILDELARVGIDLLLREPYYAHLLGALNKEVVSAGHPVDTLAVGLGRGRNLTLYVNAEFWDKELTLPEHRCGVLKHEVLHLVFKHLSVDEPHLDPLMLNVAFDLVVNQYVERSQLPDDSIFIESFPDLNLRRDQTWYYYYKKLVEVRQKAEGESSGSPGASSLEKIKSDTNGLERHQPWREVRNRSELEKNLVETHLDSMLRTAHQRTNAHAWGSMPGLVKEAVGASLQRPAPLLNWRMALRIFSASARSTALKNTLRRPSKRYGTNPGLQIRRKQRLMVALDTSGSIGVEELQSFFQEIFHLWRNGVQIEIIECDTVINRRYPYRGVAPPGVQGRGGTDLTPPIELANKEKPDGLIFFTDGYAAALRVQPRVPVLWMLSQRGLEPTNAAWGQLPGRKVKMT